MLSQEMNKIEFNFNEIRKITYDDIPINTTHLIYWVDLEIDENVLPESLTHITFGSNFNQKINANVLPNSLTYLKFGFAFNQKINANVLPNSLTHLIFGGCFNQKLDKFVFPNSLRYIKFGLFYNQEIVRDVLPDSLECIMVGVDITRLPNNDGIIRIPENIDKGILCNYDAFHNLNDNCKIYLYNTFEDEYDLSHHVNKQRILHKSIPLPIFEEINQNIDEFDIAENNYTL